MRDWEFVAEQRRLAHLGDRALAAALRRKFLSTMCDPSRDVAFYVGNQAKRPWVFSVLGVYYPGGGDRRRSLRAARRGGSVAGPLRSRAAPPAAARRARRSRRERASSSRHPVDPGIRPAPRRAPPLSRSEPRPVDLWVAQLRAMLVTDARAGEHPGEPGLAEPWPAGDRRQAYVHHHRDPHPGQVADELLDRPLLVADPDHADRSSPSVHAPSLPCRRVSAGSSLGVPGPASVAAPGGGVFTVPREA